MSLPHRTNSHTAEPAGICAHCRERRAGSWLGRIFLYCRHTQMFACRATADEPWHILTGVSPVSARQMMAAGLRAIRLECAEKGIRFRELLEVLQRIHAGEQLGARELALVKAWRQIHAAQPRISAARHLR